MEGTITMLNQVPLPPLNPIGSTLLAALSQPPASYANTRWDVKLRVPPHVLCFIPLFNHRIRADPFLSSLSFNHRINNLKILNAVAFLNVMSDYPTSIQQRHGNDGVTTCNQLKKKVLHTWVCSDASSSLVAPTEKIKWMILCKAPSHSIRHQGCTFTSQWIVDILRRSGSMSRIINPSSTFSFLYSFSSSQFDSVSIEF